MGTSKASKASKASKISKVSQVSQVSKSRILLSQLLYRKHMSKPRWTLGGQDTAARARGEA
ncbi:hypothetical protein UVI_02034790 [Ustilaginoidea virens]|uniref:Uncharacterized protein n=1 Tax=Ustilaginoidea virens TaxID=1159556 RepID=A0A1B5KSM9_USTVR|nr:hypothetical protein UVI_02034790 [Ustilaginoidea virens]